MLNDILRNIEEFEWDLGNFSKNWNKHKVSGKEAEEVFFNTPLLIIEDTKHSDNEDRWLAFGFTGESRFLTLAFTIRKKKLRVIMARSMNKKERSWYDAQKEI